MATFRRIMVMPFSMLPGSTETGNYFELTKLQIWSVDGIRLCSASTALSFADFADGQLISGNLADLVSPIGTGAPVRILKSARIIFDLGSPVTARGVNLRKSTGPSKETTMLGHVLATDSGTSGSWQEADIRRFTIYTGPSTVEPEPTTTWWRRAPLLTWRDPSVTTNDRVTWSLGTREGISLKYVAPPLGGYFNPNRINALFPTWTTGKWIVDTPQDMCDGIYDPYNPRLPDIFRYLSRNIRVSSYNPAYYAGISCVVNLGAPAALTTLVSDLVDTNGTHAIKSEINPGNTSILTPFTATALSGSVITPAGAVAFPMSAVDGSSIRVEGTAIGTSVQNFRHLFDIPAKTMSILSLDRSLPPLTGGVTHTLQPAFRTYSSVQWILCTPKTYLNVTATPGTSSVIGSPAAYDITEPMTKYPLEPGYTYGPGVDWSDISQYFSQMVFGTTIVTSDYLHFPKVRGYGNDYAYGAWTPGFIPDLLSRTRTREEVLALIGHDITIDALKASNITAYFKKDGNGVWYNVMDNAVSLIANTALPRFKFSMLLPPDFYNTSYIGITNTDDETIEGRTYIWDEDIDDNTPVSAVVMATDLNNKNNTFKTISDSDTGIFKFSYLPKGRYILAAFLRDGEGYSARAVGFFIKGT